MADGRRLMERGLLSARQLDVHQDNMTGRSLDVFFSRLSVLVEFDSIDACISGNSREKRPDTVAKCGAVVDEGFGPSTMSLPGNFDLYIDRAVEEVVPPSGVMTR